MIPLTASREQYLMALYALDPEADGVRLTDLADRMGVTLSSAYSAVKELEKAGLVTRSGSRMIFLTVAGRKDGAHLTERCITIEHFLTDILGVDPGTAAQEAGAVEHILSETSFAALAGLIEEGLPLAAGT